MSFPILYVGAEEDHAFRYTLRLPAGVTIASAEWTLTVLEGTDPTPSASLSGSPAISGDKVSQRIIGRIADVQYCVQCKATLSDGQKVPLTDTLWVRAGCAQP